MCPAAFEGSSGRRVEVRLPRFKPMVYDGADTNGAVLLSISKLEEPSVNQCRSILSTAFHKFHDVFFELAEQL